MIDGTSSEDAGEVLGAFIKQYYSLRQAVPKTVLLSSTIEDMDAVATSFLPLPNAKSILQRRSAASGMT